MPALNSSPTNRLSVAVILALLGVGVVRTAQAGSGLLGLDHPVTYDDAGIWKRNNQLLLIYSMLVGEVGLGLWEGGESRFGRTIWQSIDASAVGGAPSEILKYAFSRERPSQTNDPNRWFKGHGLQSFPSGEVTVTSSIVTPLVLEYRADDPGVYALEAWSETAAYAAAQVVGCCAGAVLSHAMFELPLFQSSTHIRAGGAQWLAEFVLTLGLLLVVLGHRRAQDAPWMVAAWIGAAYWFTGSTSFANPAITIARSLTNIFSGIRPSDAPGFIIVLLIGAVTALALSRLLFVRPPHPAAG